MKEKKRRHQMSEEEKQRWNMSYGAGYEEMQRRRQTHDGSVGPLDIEHPRLKSVFFFSSWRSRGPRSTGRQSDGNGDQSARKSALPGWSRNCSAGGRRG